ncbi:phage protein [Streptococcus pseudoporcinus]|uniref:Phage protein n=1 Tax=Streptococcus pseudoporcinus TaxID=361101 RepID=A0A4V6L178_9STRE|nr:YopX family protein [Streptococcus pseudoporcinus]VTS19657.1 phage protein [Streptococcus pseudoporcinus]VUC69717.1 phage protein [Streptococcus pseudoporcinus]VUD00004.1 phage protein [Streptococcus pseudoporcinus]VUD00397.1 phage protein [Streptococcus pseudoporcinus]
MIPKFRAFNETLEMIDVISIDFKNKTFVGEHWEYGETETIPLDDIILMQSTGFFDKNGVEIFEGDVVKVGGWKTEVVKFGKIIHEEDFGGFAIYQGFSLMLGGGYPEAVMNEIEVIGNIYELESVEE